ncbi:hypothetical protein PHYSODRAFT_336279 [Phytophthora sojae]|uniref:Uncharacterized protein n=1 Tax=Phytophthora sojae (strain P6497) TaxID=1094619 RepID=G4ZX67_PHYSP|nr:hypothetical protein PHYSODRAFT_336279 [Phytophthora sojae]EGZ11784.1 hypothetical protein PHYSODRAFT_336279 [Phytophthora sojae]|eukprot:XP_009532117.1 hypothetical protein PHYSODRAFT_336279 [Phytophthora sojae]
MAAAAHAPVSQPRGQSWRRPLRWSSPHHFPAPCIEQPTGKNTWFASSSSREKAPATRQTIAKPHGMPCHTMAAALRLCRNAADATTLSWTPHPYSGSPCHSRSKEHRCRRLREPAVPVSRRARQQRTPKPSRLLLDVKQAAFGRRRDAEQEVVTASNPTVSDAHSSDRPTDRLT